MSRPRLGRALDDAAGAMHAQGVAESEAGDETEGDQNRLSLHARTVASRRHGRRIESVGATGPALLRTNGLGGGGVIPPYSRTTSRGFPGGFVVRSDRSTFGGDSAGPVARVPPAAPELRTASAK